MMHIGLDPHSNPSGMVCVNHFSDDDYCKVDKATEKTRGSLKKNVVPKLCEQFVTTEPDNAAIFPFSNENEQLKILYKAIHAKNAKF